MEKVKYERKTYGHHVVDPEFSDDKKKVVEEELDRMQEYSMKIIENHTPTLDVEKTIKNDWGFHPIDVKVLIEVEELDRYAGKEGIIIIPDTVHDKFQVAQIKGKVVAMGGEAFYDVKDPIPKIGDKVYFAKYAGVTLRMDDKNGKRREARVVNDKDIVAVLDPEVENIEV